MLEKIGIWKVHIKSILEEKNFPHVQPLFLWMKQLIKAMNSEWISLVLGFLHLTMPKMEILPRKLPTKTRFFK